MLTCVCDSNGTCSCAKCAAGKLCMSSFECKAANKAYGGNVVVIEHKESVNE